MTLVLGQDIVQCLRCHRGPEPITRHQSCMSVDNDVILHSWKRRPSVGHTRLRNLTREFSMLDSDTLAAMAKLTSKTIFYG